MADDETEANQDFAAPHTTVRADRPGIVEVVPIGKKFNKIDSPFPQPQKSGLRFTLSKKYLGRLERLAKSRFEINQSVHFDLTKWDESEDYPVIAQSVKASSEIEGESSAALKLRLDLIAHTDPRRNETVVELERRRAAEKAIYKSHIWALSTWRRDLVSVDFLLELHRRMFLDSKPDDAGKFKSSEVNIGEGESPYRVQTLPAYKAKEFLQALCDRTNEKFELARNFSEESMFLCCAEFVVDFLAIHPFADGNGRAARLLSTYLLERSGYHFARFYAIENVILERHKDYYDALFLAQRNWLLRDEDLTPWIEFYIDAVFAQWQRAYQSVRDESHKRAVS